MKKKKSLTLLYREEIKKLQKLAGDLSREGDQAYSAQLRKCNDLKNEIIWFESRN